MTLGLYKGYPFNGPNKLDPVDIFIGTGATPTFTETNKTASQTAATIQFDSTYYYFYNNGLTWNTSTQFTLSSTPPQGSQGVAPGLSSLNFTAFDQPTEPGVTGAANINDQPFWLADDGQGVTNILNASYQNIPSNPGISIFFQNLVTAFGAQTFWMQLACADGFGNPLTYQATGTTLYTDNFSAFTLCASTAPSNSFNLVVNTASTFRPGDYILINPGGSSQENIPVTTIDNTNRILATTGLNYTHYPGELIFMNARKFWARATLPVNALNGEAINLYNLGMFFECCKVSRL